MSSVFELGYRYILPSLKRMLTEVMHEELKLSRVEIARKLGISPSAVSRYLSHERGAMLEIPRELMNNIRKLAEEITYKNLNQHDVEMRLLKISISALSKKYFCSFHQKLEPKIDPTTCRTCPEVFSKLE